MLVRSLDTGRRPSGLLLVPGPSGTQPRRGLSTSSYLRRIILDYAAQDAREIAIWVWQESKPWWKASETH